MSINAGENHLGSGFLVSSDGYVLTANHVVMEGNDHASAIAVTLSDGEISLVRPVHPLNGENVGKDFVLLKGDFKKPVSFLTLGSISEVDLGADGTVIGFPFSAKKAEDEYISSRFCLSVTFAATSTEKRIVSSIRRSGNAVKPFLEDILVPVVYFQGISIKGLSGSPVISRDTGHVVGILSTKLTGATLELEKIRGEISDISRSGSTTIMGVDPLRAISQLIANLDDQLANGLGSAVGIDDAERELARAKRRVK